MKRLFVFSSALVLFACSSTPPANENPPAQEVAPAPASTMSQETPWDSVLIKNLAGMIPYGSFPKHFTFDSIVELNHATHSSVYFIYPISGNKRIDAQVKQFAKAQVAEFKESLYSKVKQANAITSDLQFIPENIYENNKITSYRFFTSSYYEETAHPNSDYYSFIFDNITGKRLGFSDIFQLKGKADTLAMIALINEQIEGPDMTPLTTLKDIDFDLTASGVSFNFGPYDIGAYAEGIRQGEVPYEKMRRFLTNKYFP